MYRELTKSSECSTVYVGRPKMMQIPPIVEDYITHRLEYFSRMDDLKLGWTDFVRIVE